MQKTERKEKVEDLAKPTGSKVKTEPEPNNVDNMLGFDDRKWDELPLNYIPCYKRQYSYPKTERFQLDPPLREGKPGDPNKLAKCLMVAQTLQDPLILPTEPEYAIKLVDISLV